MEITDIGDDTTFVVADSCTTAEVEGELVVLDLEEGTYYGLNQVGASVWKLMREPITFRSIVDAIATEYDVATERCRDDILELLGELVSHKLIHTKP